MNNFIYYFSFKDYLSLEKDEHLTLFIEKLDLFLNERYEQELLFPFEKLDHQTSLTFFWNDYSEKRKYLDDHKNSHLYLLFNKLFRLSFTSFNGLITEEENYHCGYFNLIEQLRSGNIFNRLHSEKIVCPDCKESFYIGFKNWKPFYFQTDYSYHPIHQHLRRRGTDKNIISHQCQH